ncbi:MAG: hypothetical protein AB7T49_00290 [Oligoflexales bacterium]
MVTKNQLSTICQNLLHAMNGASFKSQVIEDVITIQDGIVVVSDNRQIYLSNYDVETLYQEYIWEKVVNGDGNE